jgi:hypothetical protein
MGLQGTIPAPFFTIPEGRYPVSPLGVRGSVGGVYLKLGV